MGYFGYNFIRFLAVWSQMEMNPSEPPDAKVLWLESDTLKVDCSMGKERKNPHGVISQGVDRVNLIHPLDRLSMGSECVFLSLRFGIFTEIFNRNPSFYTSTRPSWNQLCSCKKSGRVVRGWRKKVDEKKPTLPIDHGSYTSSQELQSALPFLFRGQLLTLGRVR